VELGEFGVWITTRAIGGSAIDAQAAGEAARLAEELGFAALWIGGSPQLPPVRALLAGSERLPIATGVVNAWHAEPRTLAAERAELAAAFPHRLLLGVGINHPEGTAGWSRPVTRMSEYLDVLDAAPTPVPREERCLAALGPRMLALGAERTLGVHTYFVPVEHTRAAREQLGPAPLIAVELACVLDDKRERARTVARGYAERYLSLSNYTNNLRRFGWDDRAFADGGSDALIDAVIAHGSPSTVVALARLHLAAGANHVCLQPLGSEDVPAEQWAALAGALAA